MDDLFDREQKILDHAASNLERIRKGAKCDIAEYEIFVKEYGRLLKQMRRITRISDRTTENLQASRLDLLEKVHYDVLTGIYNRRYMEENLNYIIKSLSRSGSKLSVLMMDIDYFKKYNDTYGHIIGDDCLKSVAETLAGSITRADDFVARYGGEEFVAILPNTDESGARMMAENILKKVRELGIPHESSDVADCVTISIGAATGDVEYMQTGTDYIKRADEALYMSKKGGRDRYTFLNIT